MQRHVRPALSRRIYKAEVDREIRDITLHESLEIVRERKKDDVIVVTGGRVEPRPPPGLMVNVDIEGLITKISCY